MASTMRSSTLRTEGKSLPGDLSGIPTHTAKMGIGENSGDVSANSGAPRAAVREAMSRSETSQKAFAISAKVSEGNVSEALGGVRPIQWSWIWAQDRGFRTAFHQVIGEAWDVDGQAEQEQFEQCAARLITLAMRLRRRTA